jgi:hypothetical protein
VASAVSDAVCGARALRRARSSESRDCGCACTSSARCSCSRRDWYSRSSSASSGVTCASPSAGRPAM